MAIIKQYVNLPLGTTNIHGNRRNIRVAPNNIPNVVAGDRVEWWQEPVGGNNTDQQYISLANRAKLQHPESSISGGYFKNRVDFPHVGGDQYVVKVSKKNDRANFTQTDTFETWRKLYYTVYYMGNAALNMFNSLEARYKQAYALGYVEFINDRKTATLTQMARVDANPNFNFMNGGPNAIINLRPRGAGTLNRKPFNVALLVVPDCYYTNQVARSMPTTRAVVGTTDYNHWLYVDGVTALSFIKRARVRWPSQGWIDVRNKFSLVSTASRHSVINWDLNSVPGLTNYMANPAHNFRLSYTVYREHMIMGYSYRNFCIVRTMDGLTDVLQTFTHEVGHGIGQAVHWENRWNPAGAPIPREANPKWHDDVYGGQGPHCSYNAVLTTAVGLTSGQDYSYGGAGDLCTMFWRGDAHVQQDGKFCVFCEPRIKRKNLNRTNQLPRWNYFG